MSSNTPPDPIKLVEDWPGGRLLDPRGRKKIVLADGLLSQTGSATDKLDGFIRYLQNNFGFQRSDVLEITYHGVQAPAGWRPLPYESRHCEAPIAQLVRHVAQTLQWYAERLPPDTSYHLIGYSLGGVAMFEAASQILPQWVAHRRGRLESVATLSAPLFGADLGAEGELLGALGLGALVPGGAAVRETIARGRSPAHRARIEQEARSLKSAGVQLLTLADSNDVVVTPEDAIIAPPAERASFVLSGPRLPGDSSQKNPFGHGPIVSNTLGWVKMARQIGQQSGR
ncbi:MAG: hypothetical protein U0821_13660 [Chloroflexota bacterium]